MTGWVLTGNVSRFTDPATVDPGDETLTHPFRRRILLALSEHDPIAGIEATTEAFTPDSHGGEPDVLRRKLVRTHLPRLAADGYVEWDPDAGTVRRGPNFDRIAPSLGGRADHDD